MDGKKVPRTIAVVVVVMWMTVSAGWSAGIVNADFNSGLTGWSGGPSLGTNPFPSAGRAGFSEIGDEDTITPAPGSAAILYQTFDLPGSATYLSWQWEVTDAGFGSQADALNFLDSFSALLSNSSHVVTHALTYYPGLPLLSGADVEEFGDPFFDGPSLARFDVSALAGQEVTLQFEWLGALDGFESMGYLDNVNAAIPLPGALVLGVIGVGAVRGMRKRFASLC